MREIKFRFWYTGYLGEGKMVYWLEDDLNLNAYMKNSEDCMQYTGLKDKSGKEIYEEDIVREEFPAGWREYEVKFGEFDNGEEYEGHESAIGWYLELTRGSKGFEDDWKIENMLGYNHKLEVIGNIYENPELLK